MVTAAFGSKIRSWINDEQKVFVLALVIAGISTLCTVLFLTDIFRDTAHVYAVFAREIGRGNYYGGIATKVPMLNITLGGILARCGMEPVQALSLVGGLFYLAVCFPLRRLLERYMTPLMAAWGCVLYVTAPKMIRFACAPLLDSGNIFFLTAAVLFFLRLSEAPKAKDAAAFGLSLGLLATSRGEGFITATALLFGLPLFTLLFRKNTVWKKLLLMWLITLCCIFTAVSPFCGMNYSKSSYFVTDARVVDYAESFGKALGFIKAAPEEKKQLFMSSNNGNHSWSAKFSHMFSCLARGGYELYWALAFLGVAVLIRKRELKSDYLLFLGITLLQCLIYLFTVSATRYYLFTVPFYMVFTLTGADFIRQKLFCRIPEKLQWAGIVLCAVILTAQTANGLKRAFSSEGKDFKAAGVWIREYGKKHYPDRELRVFAPGMTETAYWSGAKHTDGYEDPKHDPATFRDFDLAVVHRKDSLGLEKRNDLERIKGTPHEKNIWIYKVKKQEK